MTAYRRGKAIIAFPNELEIVITREFATPRELVFDIMTKPEYLRKNDRAVAVRGWPDVQAIESMELHEAGGVTTLTWTMTFRDKAGRDHMTTYDGIEANLDKMEDLLYSIYQP